MYLGGHAQRYSAGSLDVNREETECTMFKKTTILSQYIFLKVIYGVDIYLTITAITTRKIAWVTMIAKTNLSFFFRSFWDPLN